MRLAAGWAICLACACLARCASGQEQTASSFGVDLQGHARASLVEPGVRAVVLLFVATDCPISQRYLPEWERLGSALAEQHIAFYTVYPNPGETVAGIRAQQVAFSQHLPILRDPEQTLVHLAGVRITPEAAVFVPLSGRLREVYRGRIDDRYLDLSHQRPRATHKELELAVHAVLEGTPVQPPGGRPVGCSIVPLQGTTP